MTQRLESPFAYHLHFTCFKIGGQVSDNLFGRVHATGKNGVGTEFSARKTGMDRMNMTTTMQSKNSSVLLICLCFDCTSCTKVCHLWDRIGIFSKLKPVCDINAARCVCTEMRALKRRGGGGGWCTWYSVGKGILLCVCLSSLSPPFRNGQSVVLLFLTCFICIIVAHVSPDEIGESDLAKLPHP